MGRLDHSVIDALLVEPRGALIDQLASVRQEPCDSTLPRCAVDQDRRDRRFAGARWGDEELPSDAAAEVLAEGRKGSDLVVARGLGQASGGWPRSELRAMRIRPPGRA